MTKTDTALQHERHKGNQKTARYALSTHAHYSRLSDASAKVIPGCILTQLSCQQWFGPQCHATRVLQKVKTVCA